MEQGFYALMKFKTIYGRCIGSNSRLNDFSNACKILVIQFDMETFDLNEPNFSFFSQQNVNIIWLLYLRCSRIFPKKSI